MANRWRSVDDRQSYGGYNERPQPRPQAPRLRPEDFMALPPTPDGSNPPRFEHYGSGIPIPSNMTRNMSQPSVHVRPPASWQELPRNANQEVNDSFNRGRGSDRGLWYDDRQHYTRESGGSSSPRRGGGVNGYSDRRISTSSYGGTGSELRAAQSLEPSLAPPNLTHAVSLSAGQQQAQQIIPGRNGNLRDESPHQHDTQQHKGQQQPTLPPFAQSHPHMQHPSEGSQSKAKMHTRSVQVKADDCASAEPLDLTSLWANGHGHINASRNGYDNTIMNDNRIPGLDGASHLSSLLMGHSFGVDAHAADLLELAAVDRKLEHLMTTADNSTLDGGRSRSATGDIGSFTDLNSWQTAAEVASLIDALRRGQSIMDLNLNDSEYSDDRLSRDAPDRLGFNPDIDRVDSSCGIEPGSDGEDDSHYGYYTQKSCTHNIKSSERNVGHGDGSGSNSNGSNPRSTSSSCSSFRIGPAVVGRNPAVEAGTRRLGALLREARREALAVGLLVRQAAQQEAQQTLSQLVSAAKAAGPRAVLALLRAYPASEAVQEAGWRAAGDLAAGTAPYNPLPASSLSVNHLSNEPGEPDLPPLPPNVVIGLQGAPPSDMLANTGTSSGTTRATTGTAGNVSAASSKDGVCADQSGSKPTSSRASSSSSNSSRGNEGSTSSHLGALAAPARAAAAALGDGGACELVVSTMQRHAGHAAIQAQCCRLLYLLAWDWPPNHARLGACGACAALVQCLRNFAESRDVMGFGALAVAHLAWHPAARDTLRGMGCSATLETAALAHSDDPEGLAQVIAKAQGELVENERCAVM